MIYEERSRIYGGITQTAAMLIAFGAFVIAYNRNDNDDVRDNVSGNYRPNMEAILVKDEELYSITPKVRIPRKRINDSGLCDKLVDTNYIRKQQM